MEIPEAGSKRTTEAYSPHFRLSYPLSNYPRIFADLNLPAAPVACN
jgi:hypothetical protein